MSVGRICAREVDVAAADERVWCAAERMHQRSLVLAKQWLDVTDNPVSQPHALGE
jgi:hypothetical protein